MKRNPVTQAEESAKASEKKNVWPAKLLLFCGISVYLELCLHLFVFHSVELHIVYPILFGLMCGTVCALIAGLLPKTLQRLAALILVLLQCALAETQLIYHAVFGNLMPLNQLSMGGAVVTEFLDQTLYAIRQNLLPALLLLLPLAALLLVRLRGGLARRVSRRQAWCALAILLVLLGSALLLMRFACGHPVSAWRVFRDAGSSADLSYRHVGMSATTLQELRYMLLGSREPEGGGFGQEKPGTAERYDPAQWNVIPGLDFQALEQRAENPELAALDRYCAGLEPSPKNQYTGKLKGYNVIVICAESFSPYLIDPERTPTLYRMSRSGFVFENFYGCFESVTTNGEYSTCLGLFPDMSRSKVKSSFDGSVGHYLPFSLGMILKQYGYSTWAYHNNNGEFYNRSQTHPNMGYRFQAQNSGLDITPQRPGSDLEMMEQSVEDYLNSDQPFHAYYMTYSGHYHYSWTNAMSAKHRAETEQLPYPSEEVRAYIACNLELEAALDYLEQRLEAAGKLDKTVIVLTNDHYPYGLSEAQYNELAGEKIDTAFGKFHNSFICYCPGMGETVRVANYCCTVDILPTLLNLLGVEYDSRLLAGSDVLAEGRHAAILYNQSFLTEGFRYDADSGLLYTDDGVELDGQSLRDWQDWVADKFTFSRKVLNTDYYAHVFPEAELPDAQGQALPFDDCETARVQGNCLFIYREGLMDLYAEHRFGPRETARLGDYITALYRSAGSPETTEDFLPEGYLAERPGGPDSFRESGWYKPACWAFEKGLLQGGDRTTDCEALLDNVELALMIYRSCRYLGREDLEVDETMMAELPEIHNSKITETELEAIAWCNHNKLLNGGKGAYDIYDDAERNLVIRYRVVQVLMMLLYPEMTR